MVRTRFSPLFPAVRVSKFRVSLAKYTNVLAKTHPRTVRLCKPRGCEGYRSNAGSNAGSNAQLKYRAPVPERALAVTMNSENSAKPRSCSDGPAASVDGHRFPKSVRLRKQAEFDRVYAGSAFAADDMLVVKAVENDLTVTRLGLSVSRKVGNAVVRNRWKRLIREAFRRQLAELPVGLDLVARPKKGASPSYAAIERSICRLAARLEKSLRRGPAKRSSR